MGKRKRGSQASKAQEPPSEYQDKRSSKLAVNTYEDVADSEDEFLSHRDKIALDEGPDAKRRRQDEEDIMEASDEEVLGFSDDEDEKEDDQDIDAQDHDQSEVSEGSSDEDEDDTTAWGPNRADYYNADKIETEQDALDEEAEARRIQQKQRKALTEADFGFDEDEWVDTGKEADEKKKGGVVTEVLPELQVREDMSAAERLKLLKSRYPEFEPLSKEIVRLQPVYDDLEKQVAREKEAGNCRPQLVTSVALLQYRALSGYLGSIAMYYALLTSTATEDGKTSLPMPTNELREHEIFSSLETYQRLWSTVERLDPNESFPASDDISEEDLQPKALPRDDVAPRPKSVTKTPSKTSIQTAEKAASDARRAARLARTEASLAQLNALTSKSHRKAAAKPTPIDTNSDLGDEQVLDPHEAAEKARKKKSLRFYTSQIAQKANKRAGASRAAGGDDDVPHRERLRDRQERLNRQAEKRGKKDSAGEGLDADSGGDNGDGPTNLEREDGLDDPENDLLDYARAKKTATASKKAAYAQAKESGGRVIQQYHPDPADDGRRQIGYTIEKNKGLTPKRKKEVKNPRVKKRKKYEDKSKKLRSMKPTYKGGEGRGGYGGELTGIKSGLVRSVKL